MNHFVAIFGYKQKEVLKYIVADPKISKKQLSEKLGINESAVQKHPKSIDKRHSLNKNLQYSRRFSFLKFGSDN
jgi:DNA-binding CsgD family transcriptional regulator